MYGPFAAEIFARRYRLGVYARNYSEVLERQGIPIPMEITDANGVKTEVNYSNLLDALEAGWSIAEELNGWQHGTRAWTTKSGKLRDKYTRTGKRYRSVRERYLQMLEAARRLKEDKKAAAREEQTLLTQEQRTILTQALQGYSWSLPLGWGIDKYNQDPEMFGAATITQYQSGDVSHLLQKLLQGDTPEREYLRERRIEKIFVEIENDPKLLRKIIKSFQDILYDHYITGMKDDEIQEKFPLNELTISNCRRGLVRIINNGTIDTWPPRHELILNQDLSTRERNQRIAVRNMIGNQIAQLDRNPIFTSVLAQIIAGLAKSRTYNEIISDSNLEWLRSDDISGIRALCIYTYSEG
jgi:hypothetical protein